MILKSIYVLPPSSGQDDSAAIHPTSENLPNFFLVPGLSLAALGFSQNIVYAINFLTKHRSSQREWCATRH